MTSQTPLGCRVFACLLVAALAPSAAHADLLTDLTTQRHWIGYAPRNFNPNLGQEPSQAQIRADLQQLHAEGWRSLFTYSLDGVLRHVPRIAKEEGFDFTLAGVFYFDEAQLAREKANGQAELEHIDGFIVGNEGLAFGRYSGEQLISAMEFFDGLGKPITTTEVSGLYAAFPELLDVGDFVFYNTQAWFDGSIDTSDPASVAEQVKNEHFFLRGLRPERPIIIKETWWPTDGHPDATEANQVAFFQALAEETNAAGDPVLFAWGEAYDQPWKSENSPFGALGPDWGFHTSGGVPKQIVSALQNIYTAPYGEPLLTGDSNGDGVVNTLDIDPFVLALTDGIQYSEDFPDVPFLGANDITGDGFVSTLDIDPFVALITGAGSAAPEPAASWLSVFFSLCVYSRRPRR